MNSSAFTGNDDDFACTDVVPSTAITVEEGDMLGACVFKPPGMGTHELKIVGKGSTDSLMKLHGMHQKVCSTNSISATIQMTRLRSESSRQLHLHANIGIYTHTHIHTINNQC